METVAKDLDYLAILRGIIRRHKLLVAGVFLGLAIPLVAFVYMTSETSYVSGATISIEPSVLDQTPLFRDMTKRENVSTYLIILEGRSFSEAVVGALPKESFEELITHSHYIDILLKLTNLVNRWMGRPPTVLSPQQRATAELQKARMTFVQPQQAPGIIHITGFASNPRVAMDLVNTHIQILLSRTRSSNQEEAQKTREFLEQQVQQVKESLNQAEGALTRFQQQKGRIGLGSQTELDLMKLSQTESALAEAEATRTVMSARITALRQALDQQRSRETKAAEPQGSDKRDAGPVQISSDATAKFDAFKAAQVQLAKLEARLVSLRERYTDAHPLVQTTHEEVQSAQVRVAQLAKELPVAPGGSTGGRSMPTQNTPLQTLDRTEAFRQLTTLETEEAALKAKAETLKGQADLLRRNLRNMSRDEVEFSTLHRTVETMRNLYTVLSDKLMAARIREQGEPGIVRIIDPATYPLQPTKSKTQRLALMILAVAGGIAFGVAFGIEFWRLPVETESDVQKATGLPVLGNVGTIETRTGRPKGRRGVPGANLPLHLPSSSVPSGIPAELYKAIRAAIEVERMKSPFRSILFTSAGPSEGKSTTVLNLAHVFQEYGCRVLVVDADLRRPSLHKALSVGNMPGLADFLRRDAAFEQICRALPSGATLIPGQVASESAAALLASPRLTELLRFSNGSFDLILVDSAPILAVPDNLLLLTKMDRVVIVAKAGATSQRHLQQTQQLVKHSNTRILGVILNQANPRDVQYYHRRYRKYYGPIEGKTTQKVPQRSRLGSWLGRK